MIDSQDPALMDRRDKWLMPRPPLSGGVGRPTHAQQPNVVVIFADDLGWGDLSCYGSLHNSTPRLDRLADEGILFSHGYSASPTCSPTRISFYTGRYASRLPVGLEEPLSSRTAENGIPHDHPTLPSLLGGVGYFTGMLGKWHCGWLPWYSPLKAGFDTFFGNLGGTLDYFNHLDPQGKADLWEDEVPVEEVGYYTDVISRRSSEFIDQNRDRPFYLQVNYTAPHWPWEGPQGHGTSEEIAAVREDPEYSGYFHYHGGSRAKYAEMIASLDDGVGVVLDALQRNGIAENTIVIFTSDNGGERFSQQWPFVGEKGDLEEGGIRVPMIIRWPVALPAGHSSDLPMSTLNLTATILDAVGAVPDPEYPLDADSLLPWLFDSNESLIRDLMWRTREQGAMRRGPYKLLVDRIARPPWKNFGKKEGHRVRLFNVADDGREKADIAVTHPELTDELLRAWVRFDNDLLPYPRQVAPPINIDNNPRFGARSDID